MALNPITAGRVPAPAPGGSLGSGVDPFARASAGLQQWLLVHDPVLPLAAEGAIPVWPKGMGCGIRG
jgi:hypothetical protein